MPTSLRALKSATFTSPRAMAPEAGHLQAWVRVPSLQAGSKIVNVGTATQNHARWFYGRYTGANTCAIGFYSNDYVANSALGGAGMTYFVWTFEGANGINHLYRDGAEIAGSPQTLSNLDTQSHSASGGCPWSEIREYADGSFALQRASQSVVHFAFVIVTLSSNAIAPAVTDRASSC